MPYINSAGVKLPNADIIIEADEDGTVTSCRNAVTGTEYVGGGGGDLSAATLTIVNNVGVPYEVLGTFTDETYFTVSRVLAPVGESNHDAILYKGNTEIGINVSNRTITLSGDIIKLAEEGSLYIYRMSGNATVTINNQ